MEKRSPMWVLFAERHLLSEQPEQMNVLLGGSESVALALRQRSEADSPTAPADLLQKEPKTWARPPVLLSPGRHRRKDMDALHIRWRGGLVWFPR